MNEHTGALYNVGTPKVHAIDALESRQEATRAATDQIEVIYNAFKTRGASFHVHLVDIKPITGDFKLVEKSTGTEIMVEVKRQHCNFQLEPGQINFMEHHQFCCGVDERYAFSWKAQWDFIYTTDPSMTKALFIPRDAIPLTWWNRPAAKVIWPQTDIESLRQYQVHLEPSSRLLNDIEKILHTRRQTHSLKAQNPIKTDMILLEPLAERTVLDDNTFSEPEMNYNLQAPASTAARGWPTAGYRRGFGSSMHMTGRDKSYEAWAADALTEVCRRQ